MSGENIGNTFNVEYETKSFAVVALTSPQPADHFGYTLVLQHDALPEGTGWEANACGF
jgi:hypothetical protein